MIADIQHSAYGVARYAGQRMSKEDFLRWESDDNYVYEFDNGLLIPTTSMRQDENRLVANLENCFFTTESFRDGGRLRAEMGVWLTDKQLRRPDVAYYSAEQQRNMANGNRVISAFVIEFGSVSDTESVNVQKRHEYFDAGVEVIWRIFPIYQEVYVYTSPKTVTICTDKDILSAAPVLPDLQLTVAALFR